MNDAAVGHEDEGSLDATSGVPPAPERDDEIIVYRIEDGAVFYRDKYGMGFCLTDSVLETLEAVGRDILRPGVLEPALSRSSAIQQRVHEFVAGESCFDGQNGLIHHRLKL